MRFQRIQFKPIWALICLRIILFNLTLIILGMLMTPITHNWSLDVATQFAVALAILSFFICELFFPRKIHSYSSLFIRSVFILFALSYDIIGSSYLINNLKADPYACLSSGNKYDSYLVRERAAKLCPIQRGISIVTISRGVIMSMEMYLSVRLSKIVEVEMGRRHLIERSRMAPRQHQRSTQTSLPSHSIELPTEGVQARDQSPTSEDRIQIGSESLPNEDSTLTTPHEEPPAYSRSGSGTEMGVEMTNDPPTTDHPIEQTLPSSRQV